MIDITHKSNTLRVAIAEAIVQVSTTETILAIQQNKVPKGDVLESARIAGLMAAKQTHLSIPDCHPLPIEYTGFDFKIEKQSVVITVEVKTIYKTGVEVEAMHAASIAALTMYDMLKPIDKGVEIHHIRLVKKSGGKSQFRDSIIDGLNAAVIVCSDTISAGNKSDKAGQAIKDRLESIGVTVPVYVVIPDDPSAIARALQQNYDKGTDLILFTGGTGLSPRDVTPDTLRPLLDREIPGIVEAARKFGQDRTPYSMLSRSIAGVKGETLVITLPGSTKGATETMDALFPAVLHVFRILRGARHD